jgi:SAM-dependent methyltransferase
LSEFDRQPIRILDCGCGSAHLSFALYHYLNHLRGIPAALEGVDVNAALMDKGNALSRELGAGDACFFARPIIEHQPEMPPDLVIALHACDTATDEALALGIRCGAKVIMAAPCCHHDLNTQLETRAPFQPITRHGILKERLADILTDSLRALILRMAGYKTDVIEFVSSEHTGRNLMIRAVKKLPAGDAAFAEEYAALKGFWGVTPYLETLLGEGWPG